ncbi:MAG: hypothetical protein JWN52_6455 [Actinomycetia bacterium]|nr:hypothetical protein [Actinomycetes bacterium]
MGSKPIASDEALLRLGARMAEIEALYGCALAATDAQTERRLMIELATAGAQFVEQARAAATGKTAGRSAVRPPAAAKPTAPGDKLRRRITSAQHTADWIIARVGGYPLA